MVENQRQSPSSNDSITYLEKVPTMKEITPFNLELRLDAESRKPSDMRNSPKRVGGIISVDITSKKTGLLKNLSNASFALQKDKTKKVTFKKGNSMAMLREAIKAKQ